MDHNIDPNNSNLMRAILEELSLLKSQFPNGELRMMQLGLEDLKRNQTEMKESLSELKKKLLDPEDGIIVKVNKNTEFRHEGEEKMVYWEKKLQKVEELSRWQSGVNKALWIIFTAIVSIVVKLVFFPETP